jgi:photosystem II stability/assembly factor-like uncharacterized protein
MGSGVERTANSRVWTFERQARPTTVPQYQSMAKAGGVDHALGDITPIRVPSDTEYGVFDEVGIIRGAEDRPTVGLTFRYPDDRSAILKLAHQQCAIDVQLHFGRCKQPTLFDAGWTKILAFENAYFTNYSTGDLGALDSGEDATIDETVDLAAQLFYEIVPMRFAERAQNEVGQEIISINVCDSPACGNCGTPSDGCQKVFAVSNPATASPGVLPEVVFSADGGVVWGDTWITTLGVTDTVSDAECVGDNYVVVSSTDEALHYAPSADILNGAETWAKVATGFVAAKGPTSVSAASPSAVYFSGLGGYVYFSSDVTASVSTLDAGAATTENLAAIHAYDDENVVAVGANNAVVHTTDGETFAAVTGPDIVNTPDLLSLFMLSDTIWFVGTNDNALWYTENGGTSWAQKRFPGDSAGGGGVGKVTAIVFATNMVGFMAVQTSATRARILRTISGGNTWYVMPEGAGTLPLADIINSLAVCYKEANTVFAGGLADNGADGIIIKGS